MVLPVAALPFLAIAGSATAAPYFENYRSKLKGRYNQQALEGVDQNNPNATASALFGKGLIGGSDVLDTAQNAYNQAQAMARQRVASGPGYMNAQLNREKWLFEQQQRADLNQQQQNYEEWIAENFATPVEKEVLGNGFFPPQVRANMAQSIYDRGTAPLPLEDLQSQTQPYWDSAQRTENIVLGIDQYSRIPAMNINDPDSLAQKADIERQAFETFMDWKQQTYGDAEPSGPVFDQMQEIFRTPGGIWENRETTARFFAMLNAESKRRAEYTQALWAVNNGIAPRSVLSGLNNGNLTNEERQRILTGQILTPQNLTSVESFSGHSTQSEAPAWPKRGEVPPYDPATDPNANVSP